MEERKQSIKRTESRASTQSRANSVKWKDRVFSPAFHDVQIKQVEIVEPATGVGHATDLKSDRKSDGAQSSIGPNMVAPPPSEEGEEGSMATNNSEERRAFRENYLYQTSERVPSRHASRMRQEEEARLRRKAPSVPLVNLPLEPPGALVSRDRARTRQQSRQRQSIIIEQRQRQKTAILRHMQRLQTNESPQQRRLMSGNVKKHHTKRYYEVSPGVIVNEFPPDENHPQTAPESEMGLLDDPTVQIYPKRANTVPHLTKSIIWTAKNRVASSRAVSSTSSRWREDDTYEMEHNKKANMFIKMPFKQYPCVTMNQDKLGDIIDDMVRPGYELRLTTAFTVSKVKRGISKLDAPPSDNRKRGRLLKAKLKPLEPVKVSQPTIYSCHGIQPEGKVSKKSEGFTPSPSRQRQLKDQLNKIYQEHYAKKDEYEKKMSRIHSAVSRESVHRTSPEPDITDDDMDEENIFNEGPGVYDGLSVSNQLHSLHIESGVIF